METVEPSPSRLATVPLWQILLILVGFPVLYIANSLSPWSLGLFAHRDHSYYWPLWGSVAAIHWTLALLTIVLVKRSGAPLAEIGLHLSVRSVVAMLAVPLVVGTAVILLRQSWPEEPASKSLSKIMYPAPVLAEQLMWVFMSFSAGFCEEVVYRGFAITALKQRRLPIWLAVLIATFAFVFVHGIAGVFLFPFYFCMGLLFALLFLGVKSLTPVICLHTAIDLGAILLG